MRFLSLDAGILRRSLAFFLPVAALLTVTAALVYGAVQHVYRTSANDPQTQLAVEAVYRLDASASPAAITAGRVIDLSWDLDTHTTVYGARGGVLASNARLDGSVPTPPPGVVSAVSGRDGAQNWLTWQPRPGVRVAAVVSGWRGGAVLVGRSLAPIEGRETDLQQLVLAAWAVGLAVLAAAAYLAASLVTFCSM